MRLIKCPACHNDVSDEARSCPKCGQPVSEEIRDPRVTEAGKELRRSSGKRALIVVAIIAAIVIFFAWMSNQTGSSSGGNSGGNASKQGSPTTAQPQVSAVSSASPAAPTRSAHNYTYEKGSVYGYQPQLSQNQINSGAASAPLVMVRYLGEHHGVYRAEIVDVANTSILSCSSPCGYITERDYYYNPYLGSQLVGKEVIPAGSTLAAAIMQDALNGQLRVYGARRRAAEARREARQRAARAAWLSAQARRGPYVTTAVALYAAYSRNHHSTLHVIDGRRVQVRGTVVGMSGAMGGSPGEMVLDLRTTGSEPYNNPNSLELEFLPSQYGPIQGVHAGQPVTALCQRVDFPFAGNPTGERCRLLKPGEQ